jgi:hypothetical protein
MDAADISMRTKRDDSAGGSAFSGKEPDFVRAAGRASLGQVRDWFILGWVVWWSWAYVQGALAQRFPDWLGWTRNCW